MLSAQFAQNDSFDPDIRFNRHPIDRKPVTLGDQRQPARQLVSAQSDQSFKFDNAVGASCAKSREKPTLGETVFHTLPFPAACDLPPLR